MEYNKENIFARLLRKEIPAKIIYEDDYALAFHDINPQAPVHIIVIPKGEYVSFDDFTEKASASQIVGFSKAIHHVIRELKLEEKGFRLLSNQGKDGGQEIPHYHVHLFGGKSLGRMLAPE